MTPPLASGHGKVILFGEHAVVHGQPALAAALDLGVHLTALTPDDTLSVQIEPWGTLTRPGKGSRMGEALDRVLGVIEGACGPVAPATLHFEATVPVGAGLGSSAALAVAFARALLMRVAAAPDDPTALILQAADASERVFHGNPSGVDHTTSALGGLIDFRRHRDPAFIPLDIAPVPLVIAQMAPGADTGKMVAGVRALLDAEPTLAADALELLGAVADAARQALLDGDLPRVGRLMDMAHGGLMTIGVSTADLDRGCHAARKAGAWGAKLTGAGGGGCMIAVGPQERLPAIAKALKATGALQTLITRAGVQPHGA